MESLNSADARAFRDEVRTFLSEKLTPELRRGARRGTSVFLHPDVADAWQRILHAQGWAAPDWPVEYGGTGWNEIQRAISGRRNMPARTRPACHRWG